jgi:serine O-acetyltransferase
MGLDLQKNNLNEGAELQGLSENLTQAIKRDHLANIWEGCQLPSRDAVTQVLDQFLSVLFPGVFGSQVIRVDELTDFLDQSLASIHGALSSQIAMALDYLSSLESPLSVGDARCGAHIAQGKAVTTKLLASLPKIRQVLGMDLVAAYEGDPAASSVVEVLMSYPFVQAIVAHRIAHELYQDKVPLIPRMFSEIAHSRTGVDIHPGASIGSGFFIDHGTGVVIGETTVIGQGVKLYQGVTLGALSFPKDSHGNPIKGIKRHPNIEDNVTIYAGATVLGGETTIGRGSVIGGNCWITSSVPADSMVVSERAHRKHK